MPDPTSELAVRMVDLPVVVWLLGELAAGTMSLPAAREYAARFSVAARPTPLAAARPAGMPGEVPLPWVES